MVVWSQYSKTKQSGSDLMKFRSLILKLILLIISLGVIAVGAIPLPAMIHGLLTTAPHHLRFVGWLLIIGLYGVIISFLSAVFFAFRLLRLIDRQSVFNTKAVSAITAAKWSCTVMFVSALLWLPFIYSVVQQEDAPGLMLMGLVLIMVPLVIAVFLAIIQRIWQAAVNEVTN